MPIRLNTLERTVFISLNQAPAPILDLWSAIAFRAVMAADGLGVFAALAESAATTTELAERLPADPRALGVLLDALVPLGYLECRAGRYTNAPMTARWLTGAGNANWAPYLRFWDDVLAALWQDPAAAVRSGTPTENLYRWLESQPETSRHFQEGMVAIAAAVEGELLGRLKFIGKAGRLLDVGAGHGSYSIALCRKYPQLRATLFDSAQALEVARRQVEAAGLGGRIDFVAGDFLADELPSGYDVLLLFNILHGFTPEQNQVLLHKTAGALAPGGRIAVLEQLTGAGGSRANRAINGLLAFSFFLTLGGQVYGLEELSGWLQGADFGRIRRHPLRMSGGSSLVVGQKK
jgi:predicted O-methyltransferase YrrM